MAAQPYLEGEQVFLANYSDGLTDLALPRYVDFFLTQDRAAAFLCVKTPQLFHVVQMEDDGMVSGVVPIRDSEVLDERRVLRVPRRDLSIHQGRRRILVAEPFQRLIAARQLLAYKYTGFWAAMDTFKDRQSLAELHESGAAPWQVWRYRTTSRPPDSRRRPLMLVLGLEAFTSPLSRILCLGAHADDIEIGCGGTMLKLLQMGSGRVSVDWVVLSAPGRRSAEANRGAETFLRRAKNARVVIEDFRMSYFPYVGAEDGHRSNF